MVAVKKVGEVFKCSVCGNTTVVLKVGGGEMICCGKPMKKINECI